MSAVIHDDEILGMAPLRDKVVLPTLADLIETCTNSPSPVLRNKAARALYLMGAVDGMGTKANEMYDRAVRS